MSPGAMNWVQRKIYLYNVTFGLYMLDWWERYLFNILVLVLMWFIFYNSSRYLTEFCKRNVYYYTIGVLGFDDTIEDSSEYVVSLPFRKEASMVRP